MLYYEGIVLQCKFYYNERFITNVSEDEVKEKNISGLADAV